MLVLLKKLKSHTSVVYKGLSNLNIENTFIEQATEIVPTLTKSQKDKLLILFQKTTHEIIQQAQWEASCGAYSQIMFSMHHQK